MRRLWVPLPKGQGFKKGQCLLMAETVYVLIQCDLGSEIDIIRHIAEIPEVAEARGTYGIYDIFCKIVSEDKEGIDEIITTKIRRISKIRSTITLHWIPSQGGK